MLALDLLVINRDPKPVPFSKAAIWSAIWISLALGFGGYVTLVGGGKAGGEYLAGYLIELSLSVDNVFVFALIFTAFAVPAAYQHRLLFWGILGAIVFRATFIAVGTAVLAAAHWVIYLLGILLVVTGVRLARSRGHEVLPERNPVLRLFRRAVPMTDGYRGPAFVVREAGRRMATPLLAALVVVETTDIMFAIDSIPAVFAITTDPFIVFSSNLFAILGLRSLYFLLAGLLDRFVYLKVGLAALLVFAGAKILLSDVVEIPVWLSLAVIVAILGTSIAVSLWSTRRAAPRRSSVPSDDQRPVEAVSPVTRIAAGVGLGAAGLAFFAAAAALRDAGLTWLAIDVSLLVVAAAIVAGVLLALRRREHRAPVVRAWSLIGALMLLVLALLVLFD
ncbi:MAG: TerC family protein [Chloroflexi bacterium]|nr:TerC family protein [Chloroflexota bacterium]